MSTQSEVLHIVTSVANPLLWTSRTELARNAILDWLREENVEVWVGEVAYGSRAHELTDIDHPRFHHVPLRASTMAWSKENVMNLVARQLPEHAKKLGFFDADVHWQTPGWALRTIQALDLYPVIQPWQSCLDMGPQDRSVLSQYTSFCNLFHQGKPVVRGGKRWWTWEGGPYTFAHSGYAWAWTREAFSAVGGLFELGGMGSGDYHMATAMIGEVEHSIVCETTTGYNTALRRWQERALRHLGRRIGWTQEVIVHKWHGSKKRRFYMDRWDMFRSHGFDPHEDLLINGSGVMEFSGGKPELERQWDLYMRSREEDSNVNL